MNIIKRTSFLFVSLSFFFHEISEKYYTCIFRKCSPHWYFSEIQVQAVIWFPHRPTNDASRRCVHTHTYTLARPSFPNTLASYLLPDARRLRRLRCPTRAAVKESRNQKGLFAPDAQPPHYRTQRCTGGSIPEKLSSLFHIAALYFIPPPFNDQRPMTGEMER